MKHTAWLAIAAAPRRAKGSGGQCRPAMYDAAGSGCRVSAPARRSSLLGRSARKTTPKTHEHQDAAAHFSRIPGFSLLGKPLGSPHGSVGHRAEGLAGGTSVSCGRAVILVPPGAGPHSREGRQADGPGEESTPAPAKDTGTLATLQPPGCGSQPRPARRSADPFSSTSRK